MGFLRNGITFLVSPVQKVSLKLSSDRARLVRYAQQVVGLGRANMDLMRRVEELTVMADRAKVLEVENHELRVALKMPLIKGFRLVGSSVVATSREKFVLYLDSPINSDRLVTVGERVVGVVREVRGEYAEVDKLGFGKGKIGARQLDDGRSLGAVTRIGSQLVIGEISKELRIDEGELVITVGDVEGVAPNVIIGEVVEVVSPPEAIYQRIELMSPSEVYPGLRLWVVEGV